ncbi:MAG: TetR family transcriptional regulator C-terminal domain-containing protein [Acidobacteriota bacterium]
MGRPANRETRRQQIVEGLEQVMAEQGYERATVADVAFRQGLSPGIVHYHFDSKLEILLALVADIASRVRARVGIMARRARDPRERLHAFIDGHLALGPGADPGAVACWVAVGAEAVRQKEVRDVYERIVGAELAELQKLLHEALADEGRTGTGAAAMAAGILAAIEGAYRLAAGAPGAIPKGSAARTVKRMADGLIASQPHAGSRR